MFHSLSMATGKKACTKCEKGTGIFTCDGCQLSFCRKHSDQHREELAIQMDNLGQEYDLFQRDIGNEMERDRVLLRIDQWERESIEKIQQTARQIRNDFNEKTKEIKKTFDRLTKEFQTNRESDDYTEIELQNWFTQLKTLQQHLIEQDNTVQSTIHLIRIPPLSLPKQSIERFDIADKQIEIIDYGFLARHVTPQLSRPAVVLGVNEYIQNQHQIRFLIEKKINHCFFIGIVSVRHLNPSSIFTDTSMINGWWPNYAAIENGIFRIDQSISDVRQGDELSMSINCDEKILYFHHQRTNGGLQILVDIRQCPLPWKLIVGSTETGNSIRILTEEKKELDH